MRWRSIALLVPALLVLFACAKSGPADRSSDSAVLELLAHDGGPTATFSIGGDTQNGRPGSSCWTVENEEGVGTGVCGDAKGYASPDEPISVQGGSSIRLAGDGHDVSAKIGHVVNGEHGEEFRTTLELDFSHGPDSIEVPPGDYVLDVFATWDQGDSVFNFSLRVG